MTVTNQDNERECEAIKGAVGKLAASNHGAGVEHMKSAVPEDILLLSLVPHQETPSPEDSEKS